MTTRCPACGGDVYDGRAHRCVNESLAPLDGDGRQGPALATVDAAAMGLAPAIATNSGPARAEAVYRLSEGQHLGGPPRPFRRPLAKDRGNTISALRPWEAEGVSRATWYRWQKAGK